MFGTSTGNGLAIAGALLLLATSVPAAAQTEGEPNSAAAQNEVPTSTDAEVEAAQPAASVQTQVETLLAGIEQTATPEQWTALGVEAVAPLARILLDSSQPVIRRGRAAIGLGYLRSAESGEALRAALDDQATPKHVRRKAIVAIARVEGDAAVPMLGVQLSHRSARVREQAVITLGELSTANAQAALRAHAQKEKSKYLRKLIDEQLTKKTVTPLTTEVAQ